MVSPLEFKVKSLAERATHGSKQDAGNCPICQFSLFPDELDRMDLNSVIQLQQELITISETNQSFQTHAKMLDVVVIPTCNGCHPFHKECLLNHFLNKKKEDSKVNFY